MTVKLTKAAVLARKSAKSSRRATPQVTPQAAPPVASTLTPRTGPAPVKPETLRDCLAPLAATALSTSLLTYQWGLENGTLMRASAVMDFCGNIIDQANRLLAHEESAESTARACAAQRAAGVAGGGGGAK